MTRSRKQLFSLFLIAFLLITGMSYANIIEDSFFCYVSICTSNEDHVFLESSIIDPTLSTLDLQNTRNESYISPSGNHLSVRVIAKVLTNYLHEDFSVILGNFSYLTYSVNQFQEHPSHTVLINYIHNQDGQK